MGTTFCLDYHPYNIMKVVCLSAFLTVGFVNISDLKLCATKPLQWVATLCNVINLLNMGK